MLINDNLSVVLSLPERVGLHIGQTDLDIVQARELLGTNRLLGLSVHTAEQAKAAFALNAADYVGIGPVYGTASKAGITSDIIIGPRHVRNIVEALTDGIRRLPCVLIGGINQKNAARCLFGACSERNAPDGLAVISAIVSRRDPDVAAKKLSTIVKSFKSSIGSSFSAPLAIDISEKLTGPIVLDRVATILDFHRKGVHGPPVIQTITSHVSANMSANIALAFSSSPIMSQQEEEAEDLGAVTGAAVLNVVTIGPDALRGMYAVGGVANRGGKVCVLIVP